MIPFLVRAKSATLGFFLRRRRGLVLSLVVLAVELVYLWVITAGTMKNWPTWTQMYDLQAEGFRSGHLYLSVEPSKELLATPNPYDWSNVRLWFWDTCLYKGKYYLYWGPFPALALAAVKSIFGIRTTVGDQYPTFAFYSIHLVAGTLLIERMARRLFPDVPFSLVIVAVLVFGLGNPTLYMIASPGIYEAAIVAAQAFVLLGLVFAFDAVWNAGTTPRPRPLFLAGVCWAAAIACRISLAPPIFLFGLGALFLVHRRSKAPSVRKLARDAAWLAGPVAAGSLALLLYNKLRFDAWLEFGPRYMLNTLPFGLKVSYIPLNAYSYLLRPAKTVCQFPFFSGVRDIAQQGFPEWMRMPAGYWTGEPLVGVLRTTPWVWLCALAAFGFVLQAGYRPLEALRSLDRRGWLRLWAGGCFAALAIVPPLAFLGVMCATMRYVADFSSGALLLATASAFQVYDAVRTTRWARRCFLATCLVLATATVVLGLLFGIQGYDDMFKLHNPPLFERMVSELSLCGWFPPDS